MLYIVGTPIGNIKEITLRAIEVLNAVDFIAAEDTRRTAILLNEYDIKKPMISYQKFNERASAQKLIEILGEGKDVALVSDAGMPLISDPGQLLTQELIKNNLAYTVVGGPCALIDALLLSGLDASRFCMLGFLPEKKSDRDKLLTGYSDVKCTLIFYSSVHNVDKDLGYLYDAYGSRSVAVVREISKLYEEVVPDVIITDPPRAGMHNDVIDVILFAEPRRIVYVSCNPATQARDLQLLDAKYKVTAVQPVDMFPHTHHVENVVLLEKK